MPAIDFRWYRRTGKKLIEWLEFAKEEALARKVLDNGTVITRCDSCREMWTERNARGVEGEPPCGTCRVDLMPENEEAARVFQRVRGQVIAVGMEGKVIDLNYPAVKMVMDLYGVKNQKDCFEKVVRVFHHFLKEVDE